MPTVTPDRLTQISHDLFAAVGAPDEHATIVADHLTTANLSGHDSHGFIRVIQYMREIDQGVINPKAEPRVLKETSTMAQMDGDETFGQVAVTRALDIGIAKAREHGMSLVALTRLQHTGRIGAYTEAAALAGMAAFACSGYVGGPTMRAVAPFGGITRKLSTNPISMAFPYKDDMPILMDFATTISAEGKLRVARAKGAELPDYWVLDAEGNPTKNPNAYYEGGSLVPVGGLIGGHKGYALSFMVTLFGGMIAGMVDGAAGGIETTDEIQRAGTSLMLIDLEKLGSMDLLREQVEDMVRYVKDTPLREGFTEILFPGEFEARNRKQRKIDGLYIEDATWDEISDLMTKHGVK